MKRIIAISIIISCITLTACNDEGRGGQIIGGADGPTSIIVGENGGWVKGQFGEQLEKKPVRMFNIDGELYYDSGLVSDNTPRCGTMDGDLKKTVKENEIPLNSGESNFDVEGYQHGTSITKEVGIDGKWVIFKKYDTYGKTLDGLKYCYYIKGRLNNADKDSEIIVLAENENITFNDVYEPLLSSQSNAGEGLGKTMHNAILDDKWGVYLHAEDVTPKGMTLKFEQFGGKPSGRLQTGEWFSLEVIEDGERKPLETNPLIDYAFHQIAYEIKSNDITELKIEWKWLYGELESGYYCLKKEVTDFRGTGDFDKEIYEVYFDIE